MNSAAASSSSRRFLIMVLHFITATATVAVLTTSAIGAPKKGVCTPAVNDKKFS